MGVVEWSIEKVVVRREMLLINVIEGASLAGAICPSPDRGSELHV